jgi:signal peptidase II
VAQDSASPPRTWRAPVVLALCVVVADQLAKHWALNRLSGDRVIDVIGSLRFNLAFNKGMAFSQGQGLGPLIAVVATVVIVWLLVSLRTAGGALNTFGIGCVIGGAAGNLIDRAFRQEAWLSGAVVDFIDLQWFPIFNIADMAINIGAGALILNAILSSRSSKQEAAMLPRDEPKVETDEVDVAQSEAIDDEADA